MVGKLKFPYPEQTFKLSNSICSSLFWLAKAVLLFRQMRVEAKTISIKHRELATPAEIFVALFFLPAYMDEEMTGLMPERTVKRGLLTANFFFASYELTDCDGTAEAKTQDGRTSGSLDHVYVYNRVGDTNWGAQQHLMKIVKQLQKKSF